MYAAIGDGAGHDNNDLNALVDGHPTCACGQELDTCRGAHCPRCGHRIRELSLAGARRAG
jgi:hypothetical protein